VLALKNSSSSSIRWIIIFAATQLFGCEKTRGDKAWMNGVRTSLLPLRLSLAERAWLLSFFLSSSLFHARHLHRAWLCTTITTYTCIFGLGLLFIRWVRGIVDERKETVVMCFFHTQSSLEWPASPTSLTPLEACLRLAHSSLAISSSSKFSWPGLSKATPVSLLLLPGCVGVTQKRASRELGGTLWLFSRSCHPTSIHRVP
jgi:hypothetical protein